MISARLSLPACIALAIGSACFGVSAQPDTSAAPAPAPRSVGPSIDITQATLGLRGQRLTCSVLQTVKSRCQGRLRCDVTAATSLCDPGQAAPSVLIATLRIMYRCHQSDITLRLLEIDRPLSGSLSCADAQR